MDAEQTIAEIEWLERIFDVHQGRELGLGHMGVCLCRWSCHPSHRMFMAKADRFAGVAVKLPPEIFQCRYWLVKQFEGCEKLKMASFTGREDGRLVLVLEYE